MPIAKHHEIHGRQLGGPETEAFPDDPLKPISVNRARHGSFGDRETQASNRSGPAASEDGESLTRKSSGFCEDAPEGRCLSEAPYRWEAGDGRPGQGPLRAPFSVVLDGFGLLHGERQGPCARFGSHFGHETRGYGRA